MQRFLWILLTGLLTGLAATPSDALIWDAVPALGTRVAESNLIARGTVVEVETHAVDTGAERPFLFSAVTLRAERVFRHDASRGTRVGELVTFYHLGGTTPDGAFMDIPGVPTFATGERVVVLVDEIDHPFYGTSYGDASTFRIVEHDGEELVLSAHGTAILEALGDGDAHGHDGHSHDTEAPTCDADTARPTHCRRWIDADGVEVAAPTPADRPLTVADFDRRLDGLLPATPPAARRFAGSADYAAAVATFVAHLERATAPSEPAPSTTPRIGDPT